jgi:hypothetical protein
VPTTFIFNYAANEKAKFSKEQAGGEAYSMEQRVENAVSSGSAKPDWASFAHEPIADIDFLVERPDAVKVIFTPGRCW